MKVTAIQNIAGQIINRDTLTGLMLIVENHITSQALKAVNLFSFKVEIFQVCNSVLRRRINYGSRIDGVKITLDNFCIE